MRETLAVLVACLALAGCQTLPAGSTRKIDDVRIEEITPHTVIIGARLTGVKGAQGTPGLIRIVHWEETGEAGGAPAKYMATGWIEVGKGSDFAAVARIKGLKPGTAYGVVIQGSTAETREILCEERSRFVTTL